MILSWLRRHRRAATAIGVAAVAAVLAAVFLPGRLGIGRSQQHFTAYFSRTTGLYAGDEVKVLGVKVGHVDGIHPEGTKVRVTFTVDPDIRVPAEAKAAIVAPSLVTGRFVQLAPPYTEGATLADHATIPLARTAVPVEFDTVKEQLTRLVTQLGPSARNKRGSLNELIDVAEKNLGHGTATELRSSIANMSEALSALSAGKGDLFQTVTNLNAFISNLVVNSAQVRSFSVQLAGASRLLAADGPALATTVDTLQQALRQLTEFVNENRSTIGGSIASLSQLSTTLAAEKTQIENILHLAPTAAGNFYNILDPQHGGVVGRPALANFNNVAELTCGLVFAVGGASATCQEALTSLLKALNLPLTLPGTPGHSILEPDGKNPLAGLTGSGSTGTPPTPDATPPPSGLLGVLLPGGAK